MYKLNGIMSVKRLADGACIPFSDGNTDYEGYKQWLAEGNEPEAEFTEEELQITSINTQIAEAKQYLVDTDHKFYGDYEPKVGEDLESVRTKRSEARAFVRADKEEA